MTPLERHEQILQLALTDGVVKAEWIYPALYPLLSIESAVKDLQSLVKQKLLKRHGGGYYVPTQKLCLHRGVHRKYGQTKGESTIAKRVAVAAYCVRYGLQRYSPPQFKAKFPELSTTGRRTNYYVDGEVFGWVEPDCNINGDTRRIIDKSGEIFRVRARNAHWKKIIDDDRFHITIVTPSLGKKLVLETRLTERKFPGPIYVEVVEELQQILVGSPRSWQSKNSRSRSTVPHPSANGHSKNGSGGEPHGESSAGS